MILLLKSRPQTKKVLISSGFHAEKRLSWHTGRGGHLRQRWAYIFWCAMKPTFSWDIPQISTNGCPSRDPPECYGRHKLFFLWHIPRKSKVQYISENAFICKLYPMAKFFVECLRKHVFCLFYKKKIFANFDLITLSMILP